MCAGMGGVSYHRLVAAVSEAGGFGCLGASTMSSEEMVTEIRAVRDATEQPFGVDLLTALPDRLMDDVDALSRGIDEVINEARRPVREGVGAECDATAVVVERAEFWSALAADEERTLRIGRPETALPVRLPAADLAAAVDALLGNVFAHTPEGTPLLVDVRPRAGGGAVVTVADEGPGIPDGAIERGRSGAGSTGLGLDIARRTAEASGGKLDVSSSSLGTSVVLTLGPPA